MVFPFEIWVNVFEHLDCQSILNIKLTCQKFNKICVDYDFYTKRKFRGFPRAEGECKIYHIPSCIYGDDEFINKFIRKIQDNLLIRGDVIRYKESIDIFDGHKLIRLTHKWNESGILPVKFNVIQKDVKIKYWKNFLMEDIIWFDQAEVQQQCLDNLTCSDIISTSFTYDNKYYHILCLEAKGYDYKENTIFKIINIFNKYKVLLLHHQSSYPFLPDENNDYTLFMHVEDYFPHDVSKYEKISNLKY
jgi:hypothetical protein